jgi:hypothetical protein
MPKITKEVEEVKITKGAQIDLGTYSIERTEAGVKIKMKSPKMEAFFKALSSGRLSDPMTIHGYENRPYTLPSGDIAESLNMACENQSISFTDYGKPLIQSSRINLSFLRAKGLSEGLEFNFDGVYPNESLKNLNNCIKYATKFIYINYLKPFHMTVEINTNEVHEVKGGA